MSTVSNMSWICNVCTPFLEKENAGCVASGLYELFIIIALGLISHVVSFCVWRMEWNWGYQWTDSI
jgi:hypothetical protein